MKAPATMNVTKPWSPAEPMAAGTQPIQAESHRPSLLLVPFRARWWQSSLWSADRTASSRTLLLLTATLGLFSFVTLLASHNIADWDLWAKLALGAHVWHYGSLPHHDAFAFTPVLPVYVDHEWGAGTIFFGLLKFFGPESLMCLKVALACGTVLMALWTGRRAGCAWSPLLLLAIPAAGCILFGYIPVIRSHAFTFFFFAVLICCLEEIVSTTELASAPKRFLGLGLVILGTVLVWVNVHGGFVAGLGAIGVYTTLSLCSRLASRSFIGMNQSQSKSHDLVAAVTSALPSVRPSRLCGSIASSRLHLSPTTLLLGTAIACLAVTCVNPYGFKFWSYLLPAVLAKRPFIREWQPLPVFAVDMFLTFRLLFLGVVCCLIAGWKSVEKKSWPGLIMLAITAFLAWRSRRHVPFFGITALALAGPYVAASIARFSARARVPGRSAECHSAVSLNGILPSGKVEQRCGEPPRFADWKSAIQQSGTLRYGAGVICLYLVLAVYAAVVWLPQASTQVLAPIGDDPVREADILMNAQAAGNLAVPFNWGSYTAWRLFPNIKISMDGRYEAAFPESTFQLNTDFFEKRGPGWDRLIRDYPVDYVILDLSQNRLRPQDLLDYGYVLIWQTPGLSALMARQNHAPLLLKVAEKLPPTTINPLDASIADKWWH